MFNVSTSYKDEIEYKTYNVGIYLRLSREDEDDDEKAKKDSESIINQRDYLTKYVSSQANWMLVDIYIDDRTYRN